MKIYNTSPTHKLPLPYPPLQTANSMPLISTLLNYAFQLACLAGLPGS